MKKDNKGFSLVELIIVIAIMAVLVGLLAPQYLKYVNNSKVSTDISNAQEIATVFNVGFADDLVSSGTYTSANIPTGLTMTALPDSKVNPTGYSWSIDVDDNGVKEITLGGLKIWPDPKGADAAPYPNTHYYSLHK